MRTSAWKMLSTLAATAALGLTLTGPVRAQDTVKVGLLLTYSGPSGLSGQLSDNAVKLFQQKHGTTVAGRRIELVRRDTTGPNPELVKRLVQELVVREKVQVMIGPDFTPNVLAAVPLINEAKLPTFITGAATSGIVGERSPYLSRTFFSIPQSARPMAQWMHKSGLKRPVVVVADFGPGHDTEAQFTKAYTDLGGSVAAALRVPVRNPEFSSYMQRIKDAKPDSVFVFMPIGDLVPQFLKAYADSGLKNSPIRLLGTGDMADESVVDAAGDAAVGLVTTGVYATAHDSALNRQLVADFAAQFGKSPRLSLGQIAVWDAMRLIYDGVAAQGPGAFDADKFMAFVRGRTFESPRGIVTIDKASGDITQSVHVRRAERRGGVIENVMIDTLKDVPAK